MDVNLLLRGLVIGFSIAAPVGPIGVLCIRRTLADGRAYGLVSGLGAATADAIYGCVAAFGLTFISDLLVSQQVWLRLIGGVFLCYLGLRTALAKPAEEAAVAKGSSIVRAYASTFFLTLTNPMTIISFAAIFAGLGLAGAGGGYAMAGVLVLGVFLGSAAWWLLLSGGVGLFRDRFDLRAMRWINRISGAVVAGFGLLALVSVLCGCAPSRSNTIEPLPATGVPTGTCPPPTATFAPAPALSPTAAPPTMRPTPSSTPTPLPTAPPSSTSTELPSPSPLTLAGPAISHGGVDFTLDPALGSEVFVNRDADSLAVTSFLFAPEGLCRDVGCVTVYLTERYRAETFWGGDLLDSLQAAMETQSLEYFPTVGAAILLRAQTQHMRFESGAGIRAIVMRGQDGFFANNEAVVYDFHGLTDDGQYYVVATFPIDAPILLSTYDPAENTNEAALPLPELPDDGDELIAVMRDYNQEAQRQLDLLDGVSFNPALQLLDALVASLRVVSLSE
jgi:threonine/homoserine/homoserine lactone efflux protein